MTERNGLGPTEGINAITTLMEDVAKASAAGDLPRLETIIDELQLIASDAGVQTPSIVQKIETLKGQTATAKRHFENTDAALWVGDLERAETLTARGPAIDIAALDIVTAEDATGDLYDYDGAPVDDDDDDMPGDEEFDLADFASAIGIDLDFEVDETFEDTNDAFAAIAAGDPNAIEDVIAADHDLNTPSGPSQHTALLAALDAPGRTAAQIKRLVEAGADPRVVHGQGDNALSWAMGYHHPDTVTPESEVELITYLADAGANANHSVGGQLTVLQRGILQSGAAQVGALLTAGADHTVDMAPEFAPELLACATTVMLAAAKPEVLQLLLDHGADAKSPDALGRTPLDFVRSEADAARNRVDIDDEWTVDHAEALEISLGILERHLA